MFGFRDWLKKRNARKATRGDRGRLDQPWQARTLRIEELEPRVLLAASPSWDSANSKLTFDGSGTVSLQSSGNKLQWHDNSSAVFSSDFDLGAAGNQEIDLSGLASLTIIATDNDISTLKLDDLATLGANLNIQGNSIEVIAGADISTRKSDGTTGGDLAFQGDAINVFSGSRIVTDGSSSSGKIDLTVSRTRAGERAGIFSSFIVTNSSITLTDATILGGAVTLTAYAEESSFNTLLNAIIPVTTDLLGEGISRLGANPNPQADAIITVSGGTIVADSVKMDADAKTKSEALITFSPVSVAIADTRPTAKIEIKDGAIIQAAGNVDLETTADTTMAISAVQRWKDNGKLGVAFAYANTDMTSSARISADSVVNAGGDVRLDADANKTMNISASANAGRKGVLGTALTISVAEVTVDALLDGTVNAGGDVVVEADMLSQKNDASSTSTVGLGAGNSALIQNQLFNTISQRGVSGFLKQVWDGSGRTGSEKSAGKLSNTKLNLSAGVTYLDHTNTVTARIGPSAQVTSATGDIYVTATASDFPELSARSSLSSSAKEETKNTRDNSASAALSYGRIVNKAEAFIGKNANVQASTGDLLVQSQTRVPWEQQWSFWDLPAFDLPSLEKGLGRIFEKTNANLGIQNGLFTSWAEATVSGKEKAIGGSANILTIDSTSNAYIDNSAIVMVGGDASVIADNENDTLNFAGQSPLSLYWLSGSTSGGTGVGGAGSFIDYVNTVTAEIRTDAVVNTGSLLVMARTDERNIAVATQGGKADKFALNGAANILLVDNDVRARISNGAEVTIGDGKVEVPRDFDDYNIGDSASEPLFTGRATFAPNERYQVDESGNVFLRVDEDTDQIVLPFDHDLETGDPVWYDNGGGVSIDGLSSGTAYFAIKIDENTLQLATSRPNALAELAIDLSLTSGVTPTDGNTHSLFPGFENVNAISLGAEGDNFFPLKIASFQPTADNVSSNTFKVLDHGLSTGDVVRYDRGAGTDLNGLVQASNYAVIRSSGDAIQLANLATPSTPIAVSLNGAHANEAHRFVPQFSAIDLGYTNDLDNDWTVTYHSAAGNSDIAGLVDGEKYQIVTDADGSAIALREIGGGVIHDLGTANAAGEFHFLVPDLTIDRSNINIRVRPLENPLLALDSNGDNKIRARAVENGKFGDDHILGVSSEEYLTDLSLLVLASDNAGLYSVTGGVTKGREVGVGLSVAVNDIQRYTRSLIGEVEVALGIPSIAPGVGVDSQEEIFLGYDHGFSDGDTVTYSSGGDNVIGGLLDGDTYVVGKVTDADSDSPIRLGRTLADASDDSSTQFSATNVNDAQNANTIDLGYTHNFRLGDAVRYDADPGGAAIGGLVDGQTYYVIPTGTNTVALTEQRDLALESYHTVFNPYGQVQGNEFLLGYEHGFADGQAVVYGNGGGSSITGLTDGNLYIVNVVDEFSFTLANSATPSTTLELTVAEGIGLRHTLQPTFTPTSTNVSSTDRTITFGFEHNLESGQVVRYSKSSNDTGITNLVDGDLYYVIVDGENSIALASSEADARKGLWHDIDLETDLTEDASGTIISLDTIHGYQDNDEIFYSVTAYYADDALTVGTPLEYFDGATWKALPTDTVLYVGAYNDGSTVTDANTGLVSSTTLSIQVRLTSNGAPLTLRADNATGVHSFAHKQSRIAVDATNATGESHLLQDVTRVDLDKLVGSGTAHRLRLDLRPDLALKASHGLGRVFTPTATNVASNTITLPFDHGFSTGDAVVYSSGLGSDIGGLGHGNIYYVVSTGTKSFQLVESAGDAGAAQPQVIQLDATNASGTHHGFGRVFAGPSIIDSHLETIDFGHTHAFIDGELVIYDANGGTAIGGLRDGATYEVAVVDRSSIQLKNVLTQSVIDLDGTTATGGGHSFSTLGGDGFVTVDGKAMVISNNSGTIISASIAGAVTNHNQDGGLSSGAVSTGRVTRQRIAGNSKAKFSSALSGAVIVNVINDTTTAFVRDAVVTATDMDVLARNSSRVVAGAGAFSLSASQTQRTSSAVAGALALSVVDNETQALIDNSLLTVTAGDLDIEAINKTQVTAVAAGGALTLAGQTALAGSFVLNVIANEAQASIINGSDVAVAAVAFDSSTGDVSVHAVDENQIESVAGSLAFLSNQKEQLQRETFGIGAALAVNIITQPTGTLAIIEDADVAADGVVTLDVDLENSIISVAAGVAFVNTNAKSGTAGVFSVGTNFVNSRGRAAIKRKKTKGVSADRGVVVDIDDNTQVISVAGNAAFALTSTLAANSGATSLAAGAAISFNLVNNKVVAEIDDAPVISTAGSVQVTATSNPTLTSTAAGGAVSSQDALQGSFSVNVLNNAAIASIHGALSNVDAFGNVIVSADDHLNLVSVGGSLVLTLGPLGGSPSRIPAIGIANSTVITDNKVSASIGDGVTIQADAAGDSQAVFTGAINNGVKETELGKGVIVTAVSFDDIKTVAAGATVTSRIAGSTAVAGSATVTVMNEETEASIGKGAKINQATSDETTDQSVYVRAGERTDLKGVAGSLALATLKGDGLGAGADVVVLLKDVKAWIGEGANVQAQNNVFVESTSHEDGISAAGSVGAALVNSSVAGAVGVSVYDVETRANIKSSRATPTRVTAEGSVLVSAEERTVLALVEGNFSASAKDSFGGAIGVPIISKTTEANIGTRAVVNAQGNRDGIRVNSGDFATFGGDTSPNGDVGSVDLDNSDLPTDDDLSYLNNRNAKPLQISGFKGVAVTAVNSDQVELYTGGAAASGKIAVQISAGVSVVTEHTTASIDDRALINQTGLSTPDSDQSVLVTAGNDFFTRTIIAGGAFSGADGAAVPSVGISHITIDTQASIGSLAVVGAKHNVIVTAYNEEDMEVVAVSIAGTGGTFAGAGAFAIVDINNATKAFVDTAAIVDAGGNVRIHAEDRTDVDLIAGSAGVSLSGGGVGASVGLTFIQKDTQAYIAERAKVDAKGLGANNAFTIFNGDEDANGDADTTNIRGLGVSAFSQEDIFAASVAGAGGMIVGAAGAITWQQIDSDTTAYIGSGANINSDGNNATAHKNQDVYVTALNNVQAAALDGSLSGGTVGLGAGVAVGTLANITEAYLLGDADARHDVRVAATSNRQIRSLAAAASGGIGGLGIGFSFWTIGDTVSPTYTVDGQATDPASGLDSDTESVASDSTEIDAGFDSSSSGNRGDNSGRIATEVGNATSGLDSFTDLLSWGDTLESRTTAYIGASAEIDAGNDVDVLARENTNVTLIGGALAGGVVGIGGGIAILNHASKAEAYVGKNAIIDAGADVTVKATADETADIFGGAGAFGAAAAVTAQYAESDVSSVQSASIRQGAKIRSANDLLVEAGHERDLYSHTAAATVGSGAAGFSGAIVSSGGTVEAIVAKDVQLGTASNSLGSVTISAESETPRARAEATAVAAGTALSVQGAEASAIVNPTVQAATQDGVQIHTNGDVDILAHAEAKVEAAGLGVTLGGGVAGGGIGAVAEVSPNLIATVGTSNTIVAGRNVKVNASQSLIDGTQASADVTGFGISGSLLFGINGVTLKAVSQTSAEASVGDNSDITAASGAVLVVAEIDNKMLAEADGGAAGGFAAVGSTFVKTIVSTASQAVIGSGVDVTARDLFLFADGDDEVEAIARNNQFSFGITTTGDDTTTVAEEFATNVDVDVNTTTRAYIADNFDSLQAISVDRLTISADHRTVLNGFSDDVAVALIAGLGGARFDAEVLSVVNASLGDDVVVTAPVINIGAVNTTDALNVSANSTTGGGIGTVSTVRSNVDVSHFTGAGVGDGALINDGHTLSGSPSSPHQITIQATNDGVYGNSANVGSGGVLGNLLNVKAEVNLNDYDAVVSIGDDAVLNSAGEITLATLSTAIGNTKVTGRAVGITANTSTQAIAKVDAENRVEIGRRAVVASNDDINLLAGQIGVLESATDPLPEINHFSMISDAQGYAFIEDLQAGAAVSATSSIKQTNQIDVKSRAVLNAAGDAYLLTESGIVKAAPSAVFKTAGADGDSDTSKPTVDTNTVNVDGEINVGLFNRRFLELDSAGNPTANSDADITPAASDNLSLDAALEQRINTLIAEAGWFSGTSFDSTYEAERAFWTAFIEGLGGSIEFTSSGVNVTSVSLPTSEIPEIFVTSGNIVVEADNFTGNGKLTAPTDTMIEIVNNSQRTLLLNGMAIPDRPGGEVRFNRASVSSTDNIILKNTSADLKNLVNHTFSFSHDDGNTTADATTEPKIVVTNVPFPSHSLDANLLFQGNVSNRSGDVVLDSGEGSVLINAGVTAGSLSINSGGDFIFSDADSNGDGFLHIGGDPFNLYQAAANANEAASSFVNDPTSPISGTTGNASDSAGSTIIAGNVFISAQNLNVNGVIQSGVPYHEITVSDPDGTLVAATAALTTAFNAGSGPQLTTLDAKYLSSSTGNAANDLFANQSDNVALQWDAQAQRLVLQGRIEVKGGFMQLVGDRLLNTSGGELRVLDGYGTIDVNNETSLDFAIGNLDVGSAADDANGIEGTILITETSRAGEAATEQTALKTKITRIGDTVTKLDNKTVDANGQPTHVTTQTGRSSSYQPLNGLRYTWVSSGAVGSTKIYTLNNRSSRVDDLATIRAEGTKESDVSNGVSNLSTSGSTTTIEVALSGDVYDYVFNDDNSTITQVYLQVTRVETRLFGILLSTHYNHRLEESTKTIVTHQHSVKGDYPIGVEFIGNDRGLIDIDSLGSVVIAGNIAARGGMVAIDAATIDSIDANGTIVANQFDLNAPAGIGTNFPLDLETTNADANAGVQAEAAGPIILTSQEGDLTLSGVVAADGSPVTISAVGSILGNSKPDTAAHVTADSITLDSISNIGSGTQSVNVNTGTDSADKLTVTAEGDVALRETDGDLRLNRVEGRDISIDVPRGSLLDGSRDIESSRDAATVSELLTLWNDLGLIGTGADARKTLILSDTVALRNFEYAEYWKLRNSLADPTDPGSFDFQFTAAQIAQYQNLGFSAAQIEAQRQSANQRFFELNDVYGPGGSYLSNNDPSYDPNTFDPSFSFQLTQQEIDSLTRNVSFTADQLLWSLSTAVVDRASGTTAFDEDANIIGESVTITVRDTFGNANAGVQTISVPGGIIGDVADDANNTTKIALISAEFDDLEFFFDNGSTIVPWADVDDGDGIVESGEFNLIELTQREDVDIESGDAAMRPTINISAGLGVFLGSETDINLGQVTAESVAGQRADVRVKVDGGIFDGAAIGATNITGEDLVIEASGTNIGTTGKPIGIDLSGNLTVRSDGDANIESTVSQEVLIPSAAVTMTLDGGGNFIFPSQLGAAPGIHVRGGGPTGNYLRLLHDGVNGNWNHVAFNRVFEGAANVITADFDFRATSIGQAADGFSLRFLPTATYGVTGAGSTVFGAEEPNIADVFAIGFDVFESSANDVSVHWDGTEIKNVRIPEPAIQLDDGQFHHAHVELTHVAGGANVTVTLIPDIHGTPGTPVNWIDQLFIPGLNPYESRVEFAGRTGGVDMSLDLDNINVEYGSLAVQPLRLVSAFVADDFNLTSPGAILDANDVVDAVGNQLVPILNVVAGNIAFNADTVGTTNNPIEVETSGSLSGLVTSELNVTSDSSLLVNGLRSNRPATYNVTTTDDLLLGRIQAFEGTVNLESLTGSILDNSPGGTNLLVDTANLHVTGPNETIGTPANPIEILPDTATHVTGPVADPSQFSYFAVAALSVGFFEPGPSLIGGRSSLHDFNGDDLLDIFAIDHEAVLINNGDLTFTPLDFEFAASPDQAADGILAGDFNNDGFADIFRFAEIGRAEVYLNRADGTGNVDLEQVFDPGINIPAGVEAGIAPQASDIDGDGFLDLMVVNPGAGQFKVYRNNQDGSFSDFRTIPIPSWAGSSIEFKLADLTGDASADLLIHYKFGTQRNAAILTNNGDGTFDPDRSVIIIDRSVAGDDNEIFNSWIGVTDIAVGDVDQDGDNDVLFTTGVSGNFGNLLMLNEGIGLVPNGDLETDNADDPRGDTRLRFKLTWATPQAHNAYPAGQNSSSAALEDLDFDGDLDLILAGDEVMLNDGTGHMTRTGQALGGKLAFGGRIGVGDLDGDFDLDVLFGNQIWVQTTTPQIVTGPIFSFFENRPAGYELSDVDAKLFLPGDSVSYALTQVIGSRKETAMQGAKKITIYTGHTDITSEHNFAIDATTGVTSVVNPAGTDYERFQRLEFVVTITNTGGATDTETFTADIRNINIDVLPNHRAGFNDDLVNFSIDENSPTGTTLDVSSLAFDDSVIASSADRFTAFEITGGSDRADEFVIDDAGILTFIGSDLSFEDFPTGAEYIDLRIQAFDSENETKGPGTVRIHINDLYEGPGINDDLVNFSFTETTSSGATLDVSSLVFGGVPSNPISNITYEILGGSNRSDEFTIDNRGVITFVGSDLIYEDFPDDQKFVDLKVRASDEDNLFLRTGRVRIHIHVNDLIAEPLTVSTNEDAGLLAVDLRTGIADPNGLSVENLTLVSGDASGISVGGTTLAIDTTVYNHLAVGESEVIEHSYNIVDGNGGLLAQTATITIEGRNDGPAVGGAISVTVTEDAGLLALDLLQGASDVDASDVLNVDNLTLISGDDSGLSVSGNTLGIDSTAYNHLAVGESKVIKYSYNIIDGHGGSVAQTAMITITGLNDGPAIGGAISVTVTEDAASFSVDLLEGGSDPDASDVLNADNLALVSGDNSGITVNGNNLTVDPAAYNHLAVGESEVIKYSYNIIDGHGGSVAQTATITITGVNDGPAISTLDSSNATPENASANGVITIDGTFSDVDMTDVHTVAVNWGDDSTTEFIAVDQIADTFSGSHVYASGGIFTITVTVRDEHGGVSASRTTTAVITGVGLNNGELQIIGTDGRDYVFADKYYGRIRVWTRLHGQRGRSHYFDPAAVQSIRILALDGNDYVSLSRRIDLPTFIDGGAGRDFLKGGSGDDVIHGGAGHDFIKGGNGDDVIDGGAGHDFIKGGNGDDVIDGGTGCDLILGEGGNDVIRGGDGNDQIFGGSGDDIILGDAGRDLIFGGSGRDVLVGGTGRDWIFGGSGNDILIGGGGRDYLRGGSGDDLIIAGSAKNENEITSLESALAKWTAGDLGAALLDLGTTIDDGVKDHLMGGNGNDELVGGVGDKLKP